MDNFNKEPNKYLSIDEVVGVLETLDLRHMSIKEAMKYFTQQMEKIANGN